MKKKVNGHRKRKWLKPINWNGYLGVVTLTVSITILLPILLAVGQPVVHSTPEKRANEVLILAQEETKAPQPEEIKKQTETKPSQELPQKQKESANEAESLQKQAEPTTGEKPTAEGESTTGEKPTAEGESTTGEKPTAEGEPTTGEKPTAEGEPTTGEKPTAEGESTTGEKPTAEGESTTGEKPTAEQKVSLEEEKKSLGKEINERYEEWEAQRTNSQTWHSASAIATILLTTGITLFGTGLFEFPYKKLIIFILGIIAVLIQFNVNVFLLEKSIGGYKILEEQGSFLKNKLESVRTDNELSEVREQFQALILESQNIE